MITVGGMTFLDREEAEQYAQQRILELDADIKRLERGARPVIVLPKGEEAEVA